MTALRPDTVRHLRRTALGRQRDGRVPGVLAAVCRGGEAVWSDGIGTVDVTLDPPRPPGLDDQFLIASNTKTFTAVMVMQLRDEGRLSLDDDLGVHLSGLGHTVTVRQGLSHLSGLAREPLGDVWDTLVQPDDATLRRDFAALARVGRPHDRWHYSNIVYAMLGALVAELDGRSWEASLRARLLDPLGLGRTSVGFDGGPQAQGYYVPLYDDVARTEPVVDLRAMGPCGALASTGADLARWSAFVADPAPLLSADTLEEMCQPQALVDPAISWKAAMGLGFFLTRSDSGRTWVGHTGGMPGHITALVTDRESGTGGIVLMNSSSSPSPEAFAIAIADHVVEHDPVEKPAWRSGAEVPDAMRPLLGRWFSEGVPYAFFVERGTLKARLDRTGAEAVPPAVFERVDGDRYRVVSGLERGEELRITRGDDGGIDHLSWATYRVTREPAGFGEHLDPLPQGVTRA